LLSCCKNNDICKACMSGCLQLPNMECRFAERNQTIIIYALYGRIIRHLKTDRIYSIIQFTVSWHNLFYFFRNWNKME
jgi:hypothetical protein